MKLNIQLFASVSSSKYDGRYLKLTATETATSIENNTSTIHWKFESIGGSSSYYTIYEYGVFYNGIQLYDGNNGLKNKNYSNHTFPVTKGSVEGDITIEHNADGTAANVSFAMFGSVYKNKTNQYDLSLPLTTIPRASQPRLSSSNVDMGTTITIYTDRVSTTFTHTIRYAFGNANGTIASNVGDSTSWTPSVDLANQIPSAASGIGTIYCDTYSNGTLIGTKTIDFTLNVPSNVVPSVSFTQVQEAGDVPSSWGVYVRTKSRIALAISGSGVYGSAISGYKISYYGGAVLTQSATTSYIQNTGNVTFTGQVTDTRGRSASTTTTINVVDYSNPTISTAQVQRCDVNGNIDNNGEYMYISYGASISSCSNKNTPSAVYKVGYRVHNTGNYTYVNLTTNANSYSANGMLFSDGIKAASSSGTKVQFSTSNTYDIIFYVKDYFMEYTNLQLLDAGFDLMNFNASGKAMAIGKVSEAGTNEEKLEVGIPSYFLDRVDVDGYIQQWNPNGRVGSSIIVRGNSTYPEASINYGNVNGNQQYIVGWGTAGIDGWNIWSSESGQNIVEVDKYGSLNVNGTYGHQARVRTKRNDTGADIEFGVGSDGVNRGIYDNGKGRWLFHTDNVSTFISPASGDYVFISNGSYWSYLTKKFIRARQTTSQAPDSNGQLNVLFQAVDINTASSALELKTDGKITIISNDVHHVKVDCTMWVERGSTSYAWCHLWVGGTDICPYMIPNKNNGEVWQSVHFGGIASVSYGMQITPNIYFNVSDSANGVKGGTYNGSVVIDVEVLD